jgi:biopolymer transport protein ExbD
MPATSRRTGRLGQLNLTSMLDVTFLLLVFFVLTAQFTIDEGLLPADLPLDQTGKPEVEILPDPLVIGLRSVGDRCVIQLDAGRTLRDFQHLYEVLNGWRLDETNPTGLYPADHPIAIQSTPHTRWQDTVDAMNAAMRARYENIQFAKAR